MNMIITPDIRNRVNSKRKRHINSKNLSKNSTSEFKLARKNRNNEFVKLYIGGMNPVEISVKTGWSDGIVRNVLKKNVNGYPIRKHTTSKINENVKYKLLYGKFSQMIARCYNPNAHNYAWYGAKDVEICDEWRDDWTLFADWCIERGYKKGMAISRFNDSGNYRPDNCKIVTMKENSQEMADLHYMSKAIKITKGDFTHSEPSINKMAMWLINQDIPKSKNKTTVQSRLTNCINHIYSNTDYAYGFYVELIK